MTKNQLKTMREALRVVGYVKGWRPTKIVPGTTNFAAKIFFDFQALVIELEKAQMEAKK